MKARPARSDGGEPYVSIWCAGCKSGHIVPLSGAVKWEWDGDTEQPTITPSIKISTGPADAREICHSVITKGMIRFVDDSTHALSGKTIPLEDF